MAEKPETLRGEREAAPEGRRRRRFPLKTVIAVVVVVLVGLPIVSLLQPGYYQRYPDLAVRMANWRVSTHSRVPCSGCHVDPGVKGYASFAVKAIPAFYSQLVRGPRPGNLLSVPDRVACQKCHTSYRQVSSGGDLLIPHKAHVEVLGINCAVCHQNLVHSKNTRGFNSPEMSMCLKRCHDGKQATAQCVKCHTRKNVPENHRQRDWLRVHSTMAKSIDCASCHAWSPNYCADCHAKRPRSHAGNWKKLHAIPALKRGAEGCPTCHTAKFCKQCH